MYWGFLCFPIILIHILTLNYIFQTRYSIKSLYSMLIHKERHLFLFPLWIPTLLKNLTEKLWFPSSWLKFCLSFCLVFFRCLNMFSLYFLQDWRWGYGFVLRVLRINWTSISWWKNANCKKAFSFRL